MRVLVQVLLVVVLGVVEGAGLGDLGGDVRTALLVQAGAVGVAREASACARLRSVSR
jgi:hypothetical protein